jgi:hypothetical protein
MRNLIRRRAPIPFGKTKAAKRLVFNGIGSTPRSAPVESRLDLRPERHRWEFVLILRNPVARFLHIDNSVFYCRPSENISVCSSIENAEKDPPVRTGHCALLSMQDITKQRIRNGEAARRE